MQIYTYQEVFLFPVQPPVVSLALPTEAFTISLSWTSAGSVVASYEVMWQRDTSVGCSDEDEGSTTITDGSTNYEIMGLAGISSYTISVRASNEAGTALSNTLTVMTTAAGTSIQDVCQLVYYTISLIQQLHQLHLLLSMLPL